MFTGRMRLFTLLFSSLFCLFLPFLRKVYDAFMYYSPSRVPVCQFVRHKDRCILIKARFLGHETPCGLVMLASSPWSIFLRSLNASILWMWPAKWRWWPQCWSQPVPRIILAVYALYVALFLNQLWVFFFNFLFFFSIDMGHFSECQTIAS